MADYEVEFTDEAKADLDYFTAFERKIIVTDIKAHLRDQPLLETRNRKPVSDHPIAPWELRTGKYRTFYEAPEGTSTVRVVAVGYKERTDLFIRGRKVEL